MKPSDLLETIRPRLRTLWNRFRWHLIVGSTAFVLALVIVMVRYPDARLREAVPDVLVALLVLIVIGIVDRVLLFSDVERLLRRAMRGSTELLQGATQAGIQNIYDTREKVEGQLCEEIRTAQKRVLFLGVSFSQGVHLSDLLKSLNRNPNWQKLMGSPACTSLNAELEDGFRFRMLLIDPLRSPAVFRTILESDVESARRIVEAPRNSPPASDPYFERTLYGDCVQAWSHIKPQEAVRHRVRFYGQAPVCWLVVVDDVLYYQPYSFGGDARVEKAFCIGDLLPVLRITRTGMSSVFDVLVGHFDTLWNTSDTDWFGMKVRRADRERILAGILNVRKHWFESVVGSRSAPARGKNRQREYPRQRVWRDDEMELKLSWGTNESAIAFVRDVSCSGMAVTINAGSTIPPKAEAVEVRVVKTASEGAKSVKEELFGDALCQFTVARVESPDANGSSLLGLHLTAT
jgi:small basic protein